jgi:hypothetical protein
MNSKMILYPSRGINCRNQGFFKKIFRPNFEDGNESSGAGLNKKAGEILFTGIQFV